MVIDDVHLQAIVDGQKLGDPQLARLLLEERRKLRDLQASLVVGGKPIKGLICIPEYDWENRFRAIVDLTDRAVNAERQARDLATKANRVMTALKDHGASIVPHLLDTDENAGERLRQAVKPFFSGTCPMICGIPPNSWVCAVNLPCQEHGS